MCHTQRPNLNNEFRWQEVACSPACGQIYLQRILESRSAKVATQEVHSEDIVESAEEVKEEVAPKKRSRKKVTVID